MGVSEKAPAVMPRYQCHKEVSALKIKALIQPGTEDPSEPPIGNWKLVPEEEGFAPIVQPESWMERHHPEVGGYYVVYDDGYTSFSPAKAFEDGYTRL